MKIILAPYSARLRTGNRNPKNFPHWAEVVCRLTTLGYEIIQIGAAGEDRIEGVSQHAVNWPLKKLRVVLEDADVWLSCDSFLPHFVYAEKINRRGVVIFSQSDPLIWGHPENINLLKDRTYLREFQFQDWTTSAVYNEDAFVFSDEVVDAVITLTRTQPEVRTRLVPRVLQLAQSA